MKTMRKNLALLMLMLLSLTMVLAAVSCGKKAEETPATTESMSEQPMQSDTSMMSPDSMMADTSSHM